ncbi:competence pheromone ComX [Metasolibacillus sp.]|uniref:competence pheromone ComX n=1 Tax=Metasolibacillus sp. TaxID=2703680 RepID=UPI0025D91218|nr:competence pheromone ComX [Metasolibacillus sp.]MCT6926071.1 competence pheromone ComX [Metasolibacillus sp.]MCT6942209.1 competence pheromone ComX [Metasolibacillus sp.]
MVSKLIKHLAENPQLVSLLQDNKLSLVGVSKWEQQAIVEAMNEPMKARVAFWRG